MEHSKKRWAVSGRRSYLRRIFSIILIAALVIGFLPKSAAALNFFEREYIFRLNITGLTLPEAGAHPDYEIGCTSEDYRVNKEKSTGYYDGIAWYDLNTGKYMTPNNVFEEGHAYKIYIHLRCSGDYRYFIDPCTVVLDGEEICSETWDNHTFLTAYKIFEALPVKKRIAQVEISGAVEKGTVLTESAPLASSTEGVDAIEAVWTRNAGTLKEDTTVTFGQYYADLTIKAKDGYFFTWDTTIKVFGQERHIQSMSADCMEIHTTTPNKEIACDHKGNTDSEWHYTSDSFGTALTHYKKCSVCGDRFDEEEHTFNEGSASGNETTYTCTVCGYQKTVENGNKELMPLTVNDAPAFVGSTIPVNQKPTLRGFGTTMAEVESVAWYEGDSDTPISTSAEKKFESGKSYRMALHIVAKQGYYYNSDYVLAVLSKTWANDVSLNSGYAKISDVADDKLSFTATFTYKATEPVSLNVDMPEIKCGMTYGDIVEAVDTKVTETEKEEETAVSLNQNLTISISENSTLVASVYHKKNAPKVWSKVEDGTDATELLSGKVKPETSYKLEIVLDREHDYQYIDKRSVMTSGGSAETEVAMGSSLSYFATVNANYTTGKAIVDTISISGITEPAFGKEPGTAYTLDTPYGLVKDGDLEWNTTDPFTCETGYKAMAKVKLDENFAFDEDVSVKWEGQFSLDSLTFNDDKSEATVVFVAPVIEHNYGEWVQTTAPTCSEAGEETATCQNDSSHTKTRIVDPLGHKYGEFTVTKEATCTEPGEEVAVCEKDPSHKYEKFINPLGHSFSETWSKDAEKHWKSCTECGEKSEEAAHTFDEGVVTKAATETEEGVKTYTCTVCAQTKTEVIPMVSKSGDADSAGSQATKKSQPMTVKAVKKTVKSAKLKKKKQVVSGAIKVSKNKGKVTYKMVKKGSSKGLSINKKTGKITVKKGTKKGTYKIKVTVTAAGDSTYKAGSKTVTVKIKVK